MQDIFENRDIWHYPRTELTKQLSKAIQYNIMHSFTLFAPRRIGKTYFLNYDLKPSLENLGYKIIYFSFADQLGKHIEQFRSILIRNIDKSIFSKVSGKVKISEISFPWCKVILHPTETNFENLSLLELLSVHAYQAKSSNSKIVLMLDEIQELIHVENANGFIGELRTALDLNKDFIKVIFTGSSRVGLRKMFSDSKAPFFHFGNSIKMEPFGIDFTNFLGSIYTKITGTQIDLEGLYKIFAKLNFVTLSIREFISSYIMTPNKPLEEAFAIFEASMFDKMEYISYWRSFRPTEKILLLGLINHQQNFYSEKFYKFALENYQIELTQGKIQNALDKLLDKGVIHENDNRDYEIEDVFLLHWLEARVEDISITG